MTQEYNFNQVGKRMPYTLPDDFFDKMQENVLAEVAKEEQAKRHRKAIVKRMYITAASIAACVCLVFLVGYSVMSRDQQKQDAVPSVASVDKAYDNLSSEEQQELVATYANDVYLSME